MADDSKALVRQPPPVVRQPPAKKAVRRSSQEYIRQRAALVYTTDPNGMTIEELHRIDEFKHIPLATLQQWSRLEGWTERRKEVFARWRRQAEDRIGTEISRIRLDELRQLEDIRRIAIRKLKRKATKENSWEGVGNLLLKLNDRLEYLAGMIGKEMLPPEENKAEKAADALLKNGLTPAEMEAAIEAILRARVEASGMAVEATEDDEEEEG